MAAIDLKGLLQSMIGEREQKYAQGLSGLKEAAKLFGTDYVPDVERTTLNSVMQNMAGRGISQTTMPTSLSPIMKAGVEDKRRNKLSEILKRIAGYTQRGTPTAGELSSLAVGGFGDLLARQQLKAALSPPLVDLNSEPRVDQWHPTSLLMWER